jgi:hypothetical protein
MIYQLAWCSDSDTHLGHLHEAEEIGLSTSSRGRRQNARTSDTFGWEGGGIGFGAIIRRNQGFDDEAVYFWFELYHDGV